MTSFLHGRGQMRLGFLPPCCAAAGFFQYELWMTTASIVADRCLVEDTCVNVLPPELYLKTSAKHSLSEKVAGKDHYRRNFKHPLFS